MTGSCYDAPALHPWADGHDIDAAHQAGQGAPTGWCGCAFCGEPAAKRESAGRQKSSRLVVGSRRVLLGYGGGGERGRGTVIGYLDHPSFLVQLDNGDRVSWSERLVYELRDDRPVTAKVECRCDDEWDECTVHVACDEDCRAPADPVTLAEWRAAAVHWRTHSFTAGCSHGH